MSEQAQKLFKRIVLFNRLVAEEALDNVLAQTPQPEQAVQRLVELKWIPPETADKLLNLYHKKAQQYSLPTDAKHEGAGQDGESTTAQPAVTPDATPVTEQGEEEQVEEEQGQDAPQPGEPVGAADSRVRIDDTGHELLHQLLGAARESGASDLHIKPEMSPIVRAGGALRNLPFPELSAELCEQSLLAILDEEQRQVFLDTNDLDFCYDAGEELGRFRTNFMREHRGVDAVFRPIANHVPSFEELKLPATVKKFTQHRVGIVLVTGPKGCGKTTTLAAMIDLINSTRAEHIITIEDPIEFVQPCKKGHVNQRQVGPHTKSFGNALRSALREAPDVIMVGEMRDLETTSLAITAAETGHLVFATLHTPDAIRTIGRVLDVFPPKEQGQIRAMVSESLRGVVSQLLLPGVDGKSMELALEILVNTQAIGHLIREQRVHQIRGLMQTGKRLGMLLMDESLVRLAKEGRISKQDALARAEERKFVEQELAKDESK